MTIFSKLFTYSVLLLLGTVYPSVSAAQGYYYPPPPGYYPHYQQPQQPQYYPNQQPQQQQRRPDRRKKSANRDDTPKEATPARRQTPKKPQKDQSADNPPASDVSATTGPLMTYTWDFSDTLADLAKACGVTPNQILSMNSLALSQLRDGQVLKIPQITDSDVDGLDIKLNPEIQMAREVWRGVRGKKRVALTYDAGGEPDGVEVLLENLTSLKAPASFFVTGQFAKDHPKLINEISDAGFRQYNHSWSHPEFTSIGNDAISKELSRTNDILSSITGQSTKPYWRPPFGDRDDRVLKTSAHEGYRSIYWTQDTLDSVDNKKDTDFVVNRVLFPPKAKANPDSFLDGAIILMHVGEIGTANAVPAIVNGLRERGFTLVTLDEILQP